MLVNKFVLILPYEDDKDVIGRPTSRLSSVFLYLDRMNVDSWLSFLDYMIWFHEFSRFLRLWHNLMYLLKNVLDSTTSRIFFNYRLIGQTFLRLYHTWLYSINLSKLENFQDNIQLQASYIRRRDMYSNRQDPHQLQTHFRRILQPHVLKK